MALEQFALIIQSLGENLRNELDFFTESLNDLTSTASSVKINNARELELRKLYSGLHPTLEKYIYDAQLTTQKRLEKVVAKEKDVTKLEEQRRKAKAKIENQEECIRKLQKEYKSYEKKLTELQNSRDCIKACKVLTGATFVFKKDTTVGYIKTEKAYEVFEYNNLKVNSCDRTKAVWGLLESLLTEDRKKHPNT